MSVSVGRCGGGDAHRARLDQFREHLRCPAREPGLAGPELDHQTPARRPACGLEQIGKRLQRTRLLVYCPLVAWPAGGPSQEAAAKPILLDPVAWIRATGTSSDEAAPPIRRFIETTGS
jgi:hypothetical protein